MTKPNKEVLSPSSSRKNNKSKRTSSNRNTHSDSLDNSGEDSVEEIILGTDSSEEANLELQLNEPRQVESFEDLSSADISSSNPHSSWYYSRIYSLDIYNHFKKHFEAFHGVYLSKALLGEIFHEKLTDLTVAYDDKITFEGIQVTTISNLFSRGTKKRLELKGISLKTADNRYESEHERRRTFLVHDSLAQLLHATLKPEDFLLVFSNGSWVLDSPIVPLNARMQNSLIGHYRHNGIFEAAEANDDNEDDDDDFRSRIDSSKFNIVYQEHEAENEMVMKVTPVISSEPDVNNNSSEQGGINQNNLMMEQRTSSSPPHTVSPNSTVTPILSPKSCSGVADSVSNVNSSCSNRLKNNLANTKNVCDKVPSFSKSMEEINNDKQDQGRTSVSCTKPNQTLKSPVQLPSLPSASTITQKRKRTLSIESIESTQSTSKKKKTQPPSTTTSTTNITTTTTTKSTTKTSNQDDLNARPSTSNNKSNVTTKDASDEDVILKELEDEEEEIDMHPDVEHTEGTTTDNNNYEEETRQEEEQNSSLNIYNNMPLYTQIFNDTTSQTFTTAGEEEIIAGSSIHGVNETKKETLAKKSSHKKKNDSSDSSDDDSQSEGNDKQFMISYDPSEGSEHCMGDDSEAESFKSAFSTKIPSPKKKKNPEEETSEGNKSQSVNVKDCRIVVQKLANSDVQSCLSNNMSISLLKVKTARVKLNQSNVAGSSDSIIHSINSPRRSPRKIQQ